MSSILKSAIHSQGHHLAASVIRSIIMPTVFLAGASRGVGLEIATRLTQQQFPTIALLRQPQPLVEALGVQIRSGDALNLDDLTAAMAGPPIDTVISTIGGLSPEGVRSDFTGNRHLIDAAMAVGVKHFILVTSLGTGDSAIALPAAALQTLSAVLQEKNLAEQHLRASGLTYTIVRPGGLKSEPATGTGVLTLDPSVGGLIHRADVAALICQCVHNNRSHNQTLGAVDRTMVYGDRAVSPFDLSI
jgi:nucleoside-diphosphate-sugar epimerase